MSLYKINRCISWRKQQPFILISTNNFEFPNADVYLAQYSNENKMTLDPIEAVHWAIDIQIKWFNDWASIRSYFPRILLVWNGTVLGEDSLFHLSKKIYDKAEKCSNCKYILDNYSLDDFDYPDFKFCSNKCMDTFEFEKIKINDIF